MNEVEHVARKIENLQQEYAKLNQFNWKTNDLNRLQANLERMTRDYAKMESNLEQGIIIGLEQTCQDLREQHVVAQIEFDKEKQSFIIQIQEWKG